MEYTILNNGIKMPMVGETKFIFLGFLTVFVLVACSSGK